MRLCFDSGDAGVHYAGGKAKIAKPIAKYLESIRKPGQLYIEPFVGAANVIARMSGPREAYDAHPDLILMWQALQRGWQPPREVSESTYRNLRGASPSALRGFVGFGCCFGGVFFAGLMRICPKGKHGIAISARSAVRKAALLGGVTFERSCYSSLHPRGALIYCDPPYLGTMGFRGVGAFDHGAFWQWVRERSRCNTVIVSEAQAPDDFVAVMEVNAPTGLRNRHGKAPRRREFLFAHVASVSSL